MSEKEEKDGNEDKSIAGTQIINLHLSDIFKNIKEYTDIGQDKKKKGLIAKIISKAKTIAEKDQMIKIKLNGSYCKYFRIGADEFTQNDAAFKDGDVELGTLDERGVFIFSSGTKAPVIVPGSGEGDEKNKNTEQATQEATDKILVLLNEGETGEVGSGAGNGSNPQNKFRPEGRLTTPGENDKATERGKNAASRQKWETLIKKNTEMGKLAITFEKQWNKNKNTGKTTIPPDKIEQKEWEEFVKLRKDKKWEELLTFIDKPLKIQKARKKTNQQIVQKSRQVAKNSLFDDNKQVVEALVRRNLNKPIKGDDIKLKNARSRITDPGEWTKLEMAATERVKKIQKEQTKKPEQKKLTLTKTHNKGIKGRKSSYQKKQQQQRAKANKATGTNIKKQKIINYIVLVWIRWINNNEIDLTKHAIIEVDKSLPEEYDHPVDDYLDSPKPTMTTLRNFFEVLKIQFEIKGIIQKNEFTKKHLNIFAGGKNTFNEGWNKSKPKATLNKANQSLATAIAHILFDTYDIPVEDMDYFNTLQNNFNGIWNEEKKDIADEARKLFNEDNMYTNVKKWFDFKIKMAVNNRKNTKRLYKTYFDSFNINTKIKK